MRKPASPHPSPWAVALLFATSAFTLISMVLLSGEFTPYW